MSDDEVAELLGESDDDEEDDSDVKVVTDDEALDAPPQASPRKPLPAAAAGKNPRAASPRAAGAVTASPSDAGPRASQRKSGSGATTHGIDPPGDRHKWLESLVGQWDYRMNVWQQPGGTPSRSIGSAEAKWTLGQRFVQIKSQGTLLGASYGSLWTLGYDNAKQAYTSLYLDDRSTGLFLAEGQAAADGQTLQLFGAMHDWLAGEHNRAYLYVIRLVGREKWTLEVQDVLRAEPILEVVFSRKK